MYQMLWSGAARISAFGAGRVVPPLRMPSLILQTPVHGAHPPSTSPSPLATLTVSSRSRSLSSTSTSAVSQLATRISGTTVGARLRPRRLPVPTTLPRTPRPSSRLSSRSVASRCSSSRTLLSPTRPRAAPPRRRLLRRLRRLRRL